MPRRISKKSGTAERRLAEWITQHRNVGLARQAEQLPLRQDIMTLLTFVRDTKVIGTQSTGNMPLKSVRQVTARFVKPPILDHTIGAQIFKLRSEAEVWPLHFLRILAEVGGLLGAAPARRWRLTPHGEKFLEAEPLLQLSFLLTIWWTQVNWLVVFPFEGMGEALPPFFNLATLAHLRILPVGTTIPFEEFADRLIKETGLTWTAQDSSYATGILRSSIARMTIDILADFGVVTRDYREEPLGRGTISKLDAFEITRLGKALLDAVTVVSG